MRESEWTLLAALAAFIAAVSPHLYRFIKGQAILNQSDHTLVVNELKAEIDRLTTRLDARIRQLEDYQNRLIEAEKHAASCDIKVSGLLDQCEWLKSEILRMKAEKS